jgi:hypothetical protein
MKKNREDKPTGTLIHTYMEISQGNFLCSYLYLKKAKISFFFFNFTKSEKRRVEQVLPREGLVKVGGGR